MTEENIEKRVDESWKEAAKKETESASTKEETNMPKADFENFITTLALQAMVFLGAIPNPLSQKKEEDIIQARFIIDTLVMFKEKTACNLSEKENKILESLGPMRGRRGNGMATTAVSVRGQTIIPKHLREACRIREGDVIQWHLAGRRLWGERVIVRPAQEAEELSARDWARLDALVARQRRRHQLTRYETAEAAKTHSRMLRRHGR